MRILFLSQIVPYPPHGGVLQRGYHILRELSRSAEVHLRAFVHPDVLGTEAAIEDSRRALGSFCTTVEYFPLWVKGSAINRMAAIAAGALSSRPFSALAHRSTAFHTSVRESLRTIEFDVVHVDTLALGQFVDGKGAVPSTLTHHNVESMLMERRSQVESRSLAKRYLSRESRKLKAYEAEMSPTFDVNIMMSSRDAQTLSQMVPGIRTAVVPNGVDVEYFSPASEDDSNTLIYTGGMNMFANRDAVLYFIEEVWPLIRERVSGARFVAVGQDPPKELLAHAARDGRIIATGYVDDIRPLVRQAAVYVVPLRVGGGTRLKVLDAMAMGKALVSTSIGCEGLDVAAGLHLAIADAPQVFADTVVDLLGNRQRRRDLGRAARTLVMERYAWPVVGTQLLDAYRQAIAVKARTA